MVLHFDDLRDRRIVRTWTTLNKWIDERGFPPARLLAGARTWTEREVLAWIEAQPTDKSTKGMAGRYAAARAAE
jgi:hypothetical protein